MVLVLFSGLFRNQGPQLVKVDSWHVVLVLAKVEISHTDLRKGKINVQNQSKIFLVDIRKEVQENSAPFSCLLFVSFTANNDPVFHPRRNSDYRVTRVCETATTAT